MYLSRLLFLKDYFLRIFAILCVVFCSPVFASESSPVSINVFGLSHHFDDNNGLGYKEFNYGLGIQKQSVELYDLAVGFQAGMFRNSYDDLAAWLGAYAEYEALPGFMVGVDVRHWETYRNTYRRKLLSIYPTFSVRLGKRAWLHTLVRKSGPIFSVRIEFD